MCAPQRNFQTGSDAERGRERLSALAGALALFVHELADLALLPVARRPRKQLVGIGRVQADEEAPADQNFVKPGLTRRRLVDQEQGDVPEHKDAEVRVEQAQALHLAPRPLLQLDLASRLADACSGAQLDGLASAASNSLRARLTLHGSAAAPGRLAHI